MPKPPDRLTGLMDHLAALDSGGAEPGRHRNGDAPGGRPGLFTLPVALRSAMVAVRPSAVLGAVALLVVALAVVGVRTAWAQRAAEPTPVTSSEEKVQTPGADAATAPSVHDEGTSIQDSPTPASQDPASPSSSTDSDTTQGSPENATTYVHVIGAVLQPGVVEVRGGDRVADVVEAAGGLSKNADLSRINLAREVLDGERIWVPVDGKEPPEEVAEPAPSDMATDSESNDTGVPGTGASGPIDVNTADSSTLQALPGVGPVTAESIIAWRSEHGRFSTVEELMEVSGIGPRTLEKLRPHLVVDL